MAKGQLLGLPNWTLKKIKETEKIVEKTTINGKSLSENITLTAEDVNADEKGAAQTVQNSLDNHTTSIHFTQEEREKLSGIEAGANNYTHPASGIEAGTYKSVTVDAQGHITGGTNPTTLAEYGITDAEQKGTASSTVSAHNVATDTHNDIRLLITGLTDRLNALANSDDTTLDQMKEVVAYIKANRELIESVTTTKVNVSDIIDNLTTNVGDRPLSAAQGVAIKGLIDTLQGVVDSKANTSDLTSHTGNTDIHVSPDDKTNWNNAVTGIDLGESLLDTALSCGRGIYKCHLNGDYYTSNDLPHPACRYGTATIIKRNVTTITVILTCNSNENTYNHMYFNMSDGSKWFGWQRVCTDVNPPKNIGINYIDVNTDLNSITEPGFYYCPGNNIVATLSNSPTGEAFFLIVGRHAGFYQEIIEYRPWKSIRYMRSEYNGVWGDWQRIYSTIDPPDFSELKGSVGGTNLFTGTKDFTGNKWETDTLSAWENDSTSYKGFSVKKRWGNWGGLSQEIQVKSGEIYTFSAYIKHEDSNGKCVFIYNQGSKGTTTATIIKSNANNVEGFNFIDWTRVYFTIKADGDGTLYPTIENINEHYLYICGIKFEKGNVATDWSPAPEDIQPVIDNTQISRFNLESAGWYRIAEYRGGHESNAQGSAANGLEIFIKRVYNNLPNEMHKLLLQSHYGHQRFSSIGSSSQSEDSHVITGIRYVRSGAIAYIDIWYNTNVGNAVSVILNNCVDMGVISWKTINPHYISDAVEGTLDGETVSAFYTIPASVDPVNTATLETKLANTTQRHYQHTIDLSDTSIYDENTWYPCVGSPLPYAGLRRLEVAVHLNSVTKPSWSTHANGFTCNLDLLIKGYGWGTTDGQSICLDYSCKHVAVENGVVNNPCGYYQLYNSNRPVLRLRGGGRYYVYTDYETDWTPKTTEFEYSGEIVAPVTTNPGVTLDKSTIHANLEGNASTATALTTSAGSKTEPVYFKDGKPVACRTISGIYNNSFTERIGSSNYYVDSNSNKLILKLSALADYHSKIYKFTFLYSAATGNYSGPGGCTEFTIYPYINNTTTLYTSNIVIGNTWKTSAGGVIPQIESVNLQSMNGKWIFTITFSNGSSSWTHARCHILAY